MSEVYVRPEPSLIPIPRPFCPACQRRMRLVGIGSSFNGPDLRMFECSNCGHFCERSASDPVSSAK